MTDWQPIDSAPTDGTFLVWLSEPHKVMNSRVGVMMAHPNVKFINGMFHFDVPPATHWMPLPPEPTDER